MRESPTWAIDDLVVEEQRRDDRGAHAFALRLRARRLIDDLVRAMDGVAQDDARAGHAGCPCRARVRSSRSTDSRTRLSDGLDGDAARDFARVVAAHAVGQHQQPDVRVEGDRVLVVLANFAGVRQPDAAELGAQAHSVMLRARRAREL